MIKKLYFITLFSTLFMHYAQAQLTFSPGSYDENTKKYSYDLGQVIQDKESKEVTFSIKNMTWGDTYRIELIFPNKKEHTNGICTSPESDPYILLSSTLWQSFNGQPKIGVTFSPKSILERIESNGMCIISGNNIDNFGIKDAIIRIYHRPSCVSIGLPDNSQAPLSCPENVYEILLTGKSINQVISGINNLQHTALKAYPNPVKNVLNFTGKGVLYNLHGNLIIEGDNSLDVSELENGLYILKTKAGITKIIKE